MTLFVASFPLEDPNAAGSVLIESLNSAGQAVSARTVPVANRTLRLSWPWTENIRLTPTVGDYGRFNGVGMSNPPKLRVTYQK